MIIGLPKETFPSETRVALLPSEIKRASSDKILFQVETGAGLGAYFSDDSYKESVRQTKERKNFHPKAIDGYSE